MSATVRYPYTTSGSGYKYRIKYKSEAFLTFFYGGRKMIRFYQENNFKSVQSLYKSEGWLTAIDRIDETKDAFR